MLDPVLQCTKTADEGAPKELGLALLPALLKPLSFLLLSPLLYPFGRHRTYLGQFVDGTQSGDHVRL